MTEPDKAAPAEAEDAPVARPAEVEDAPVELSAEQLDARRQSSNRATRRGLAAMLCLEAFAVLLVPRAIAQTTGLGGLKTGLLVGFAVLLVASSAQLRRPWGIGLGTVLHVPLILIGVWAHAFFVVGVLFAGVWLYLLNLRHELAGTPGGVRMLVS